MDKSCSQKKLDIKEGMLCGSLYNKFNNRQNQPVVVEDSKMVDFGKY
jgi:hypothetical protein